MWIPKNLRFRRALFWFVIFAAAGVGGFLVFMFSGIYNVAASVQHFDVTNHVIKIVLRRSIQTHSGVDSVPALDDPGLVRLGANHYRIGCAPCHGSPASPGSAVVARMYPAPPPLTHARDDWSSEDLHWIVRNGLKFTGMPAWPGAGRSTEVWPLVAFIEALPDMSPSEYGALIASPDTRGAAGLDLGSGDGTKHSLAAAAARCAACHGAGGAEPVDGLVPALAGQKADYLARALTEYRDDVRQSGIMEPVAHDLDDAAIRALAQHYADAGRTGNGSATGRAAPAAMGNAERGRRIVDVGLPQARVAPCGSCHGASRSSQFPRIDGLSFAYIVTQLELFRTGVRAASPYAAIMANVAGHLDETMMKDVAAYLAARPPEPRQPAPARPEAAR